MSGRSDDHTGTFRSISIRNLDNGERQEVGKHEPSDSYSLIVAPPLTVESMLHLSHLSGDEKEYNWSISFHFE